MPLSLPYRIMIIGVLFAGIFAGGIYYGRLSGRENMLKDAIVSFKKREKIDHDIANLNNIDLCVALGGLPDECAQLVPGLVETAKDQQSGTDGER